MSDMEIVGRPIGPEHAPYVIAEISGNHRGRLDEALLILEKAAEAGADAVKLQTYTADSMTLDHDGPGFVVEGGLWAGRRLHELYEEAHTPWEWHAELFARGRELDVAVFSSPFDGAAVDLLESLEAPAYKIASPELVDLPLIRLAAATGKPLLLSTGMATVGEIDAAVAAARSAGCRELALLHCVSGYPAPPKELHLRTIAHMAETFNVPVGFSDHTLGTAGATAAVALGAVLVEKHVCLRRADQAVDAAFSLEPDELATLVADVRTAAEARGEVRYGPTASEAASMAFRRSLYAVRDIAEGEHLTADNVRAIRPGHGLPPAAFEEIRGRLAAKPLRRGEPITWESVGTPG